MISAEKKRTNNEVLKICRVVTILLQKFSFFFTGVHGTPEKSSGRGIFDVCGAGSSVRKPG